VGHLCNLATEFNGLVSKRVNRKIGPFYILKIPGKNYFFSAASPSLLQLNSQFTLQTTDRYPKCSCKLFQPTENDGLILVYE